MGQSEDKPVLARYFEAAAVIVGLAKPGRHRLELIFEDGHLVQWWSHAERQPARDLGRFDESAASMVRRG